MTLRASSMDIYTSGQDDPFGSFGRRFLFADTGLDVRQCAATPLPWLLPDALPELLPWAWVTGWVTSWVTAASAWGTPSRRYFAIMASDATTSTKSPSNTSQPRFFHCVTVFLLTPWHRKLSLFHQRHGPGSCYPVTQISKPVAGRASRCEFPCDIKPGGPARLEFSPTVLSCSIYRAVLCASASRARIRAGSSAPPTCAPRPRSPTAADMSPAGRT